MPATFDISTGLHTMSQQQLRDVLERESRRLLNCSADEALERLDAGEYRGKPIADRLTVLKLALNAS